MSGNSLHGDGLVLFCINHLDCGRQDYPVLLFTHPMYCVEGVCNPETIIDPGQLIGEDQEDEALPVSYPLVLSSQECTLVR